MQLPAPQLSEALSMCQELRDPLREHLLSFTEGQRAHIPQSTQEVVLGSPKEVADTLEEAPPEKEKVPVRYYFSENTIKTCSRKHCFFQRETVYAIFLYIIYSENISYTQRSCFITAFYYLHSTLV